MKVVPSVHVVQVMSAALEAAALASDTDQIVVLMLAAYHDMLEGEIDHE